MPRQKHALSTHRWTIQKHNASDIFYQWMEAQKTKCNILHQIHSIYCKQVYTCYYTTFLVFSSQFLNCFCSLMLGKSKQNWHRPEWTNSTYAVTNNFMKNLSITKNKHFNSVTDRSKGSSRYNNIHTLCLFSTSCSLQFDFFSCQPLLRPHQASLWRHDQDDEW